MNYYSLLGVGGYQTSGDLSQLDWRLREVLKTRVTKTGVLKTSHVVLGTIRAALDGAQGSYWCLE